MKEYNPKFTYFIDLEKLQSVLRRLCASVKLGCCVVDPQGGTVIEEGWECFCKSRHSDFKSIDFQRCIDSSPSITGRLIPGQKSHVLTCRNGFSSIGAPIRIEGLYIASIYVGLFVYADSCQETTVSTVMSGHDQAVEIQTQAGDLPVFTQERIQRLAYQLELLVELICEMGSNHLREKRAGDILRRSENRYRELVNSLPQVVFETDRQSRLTFLNHSAYEILGYVEQELVEDSVELISFIAESERDSWVARFSRIFNGEILQATECIAQRRNGNVFPGMLSLQPLYYNGDEVIGLRGVLVDMSAHRQAEKNLEESEQRYTTLFHKSHDAILVIEEDVIVDCNIRALELFQSTREQLVGESFSSFIRSVDISSDDFMERILRNVSSREGGRAEQLEWSFSRKEDTMVEAEVSLSKIEISDRNLLQMTIHDVTVQNQSQRMLETKEAAWSALFEHAPFGIAINRLADGVYLDVNPAIEEASGRKASDIIGRAWAAFQPESQRSASHSVKTILLEKGFTGIQEAEVLRDNGTTRSVLYSAATFDSGGERCVVSMVVDISERKSIEKKLHQSEAKLRSLFQTVPIGLAILKDRVFQTVNERLAEITGYSTDMLLFKSSRCLYFNDEDYQNVGKTIYGNPDSSGRNYVETSFRHRDGSARYVSMFAAPLDPEAPSEGTAVAIQDITEQKEMIKALQDSEERFRRVSDFSGQLMYDYDVLSGSILWFGRIPELTGFTEAEIASQGFSGWTERIHPEDLGTTLKLLAEARGKGTIFRADYRYQRADKSYFYAYEEGSFIYNREGEAVRMLGTLKDVTRQKIAEVALQENEKRYRTLFEASGDAIFIVKDGVIVDCNHKALDVFDCSRRKIISRSPVDLSVPIQPGGYNAAIMVEQHIQAVELGQSLDFEWKLRRPDGSSFYAEVSLSLVELSGESFIQAIIRDISERKETEKILRESEFRFRSFFNTNPEGILLLDFQGRILDANKAFMQQSGYSITDCIHQSFKNFVPEHYKSEIVQSLISLRAGIASSSPLKASYWAKDGRIVPVSLKGWVVTDEKSNPLYLGVFIQDLTKEIELAEEKVVLERQVIRAQKSEAIGTLASGIAHDFNNILGGIIGYTELSLYRDPSVIDSKTREYLGRVLEGSNRAKGLVQQILRFSRNADSVMEPIVLSPIITETLLLLQSTLPATIIIDKKLHAVKDKILGDSNQLHQVVMNIATNGYHAMKDTGGTLTVAAENIILAAAKQFMSMVIPPGEYFKLSVSDTGCGMPPSVLERIFEPYFTTKNVNEGTGLGMAVVSGIVKSHKGLIDIRTVAGKGTTFDLYFPLFQGEGASRESHDLSLPLGNGERILVVDDEAYFLEVVCENLIMLGYNVHSCRSSLNALEKFRKDPDSFDLLITDQTMPEMTGVQLIQEIRTITDALPIILCTGFSEVVTEESAGYYGIQHFLMKPVNAHDLARAVSDILSSPGRRNVDSLPG